MNLIMYYGISSSIMVCTISYLYSYVLTNDNLVNEQSSLLG